jgi:hypothetical protein
MIKQSHQPISTRNIGTRQRAYVPGIYDEEVGVSRDLVYQKLRFTGSVSAEREPEKEIFVRRIVSIW